METSRKAEDVPIAFKVSSIWRQFIQNAGVLMQSLQAKLIYCFLVTAVVPSP